MNFETFFVSAMCFLLAVMWGGGSLMIGLLVKETFDRSTSGKSKAQRGRKAA